MDEPMIRMKCTSKVAQGIFQQGGIGSMTED
jgi:hypothetical protein